MIKIEIYTLGHSNYPFDKFIEILKKYNIKFHDNNELIDIINRHKKKAFVYFEIINKQNLKFYFNIIDYIEST